MAFPVKGIGYEVSFMMHGQGPVGSGKMQPCSDMEINAVECLEAYGSLKGTQICHKFFEDVFECKHAELRHVRQQIMQETRYKKLLKGEIPLSQRRGAPYPYDSFVTGTFYP